MAGISGNPIDTDLVAGNVANGIDIFGVVGTLAGGATTVAGITGNPNAIAMSRLFDSPVSSFAGNSTSFLGVVDDATHIFSIGAVFTPGGGGLTQSMIVRILRVNKISGVVDSYFSPVMDTGGYAPSVEYTLFSATFDGTDIYLAAQDNGTSTQHGFSFNLGTQSFTVGPAGFNVGTRNFGISTGGFTLLPGSTFVLGSVPSNHPVSFGAATPGVVITNSLLDGGFTYVTVMQRFGIDTGANNVDVGFFYLSKV